MSSKHSTTFSSCCPPLPHAHCISQLSPCAPPSLAQSRCSSILISDQCPYSKLSFGSISPIYCDNASAGNNNEIKIIITDPQDNSVFSSVHDPYRRGKKPATIHVSSAFFRSSIHKEHLRNSWFKVILTLCAVVLPAVVGLCVGLLFGWGSLPGLTVSSCLFFASASLLVLVLLRYKCCQLRLMTRPQYCSLQGENNKEACLSPNTQRENSMIRCAEKKISRTEFFLVK